MSQTGLHSALSLPPSAFRNSRPGRCAHCPIAEGPSCQGEFARWLCMLIDPGHPDYNPGYIAAIQGLARSRGTDEVPPAPRPDVAETLSFLGAMRACPFRAVNSNCGCSGARCGLRRGGIVSYQDCMSCAGVYDLGAATKLNASNG